MVIVARNTAMIPACKVIIASYFERDQHVQLTEANITRECQSDYSKRLAVERTSMEGISKKKKKKGETNYDDTDMRFRYYCMKVGCSYLFNEVCISLAVIEDGTFL